MQKIRLNTIIYRNGKYCVFLDKDTRYYFDNKRKAADFLTAQGQKLDMTFLMVSEYTTELTSFVNLYNLGDYDYKFKSDAKDIIDFLNNRIGWLSAHRNSENSQAIIMQSLKSCLDNLGTGFGLIQAKAAERNNAIDKRRCALRIYLIGLFSRELYAVNSEASGSQSSLKVV